MCCLGYLAGSGQPLGAQDTEDDAKLDAPALTVANTVTFFAMCSLLHLGQTACACAFTERTNSSNGYLQSPQPYS
jgi:hypothetical protein